MSSPPDGHLELKVALPASTDLTNDLNLSALQLFRDLVSADSALDPTWKQAMLEAVDPGIPDDLAGLAALAFGRQSK